MWNELRVNCRSWSSNWVELVGEHQPGLEDHIPASRAADRVVCCSPDKPTGHLIRRQLQTTDNLLRWRNIEPASYAAAEPVIA